MNMILLVKSLHIFSIIAWFVGIFYLPRLFVYHAQLTNSAADKSTAAWFKIMEKRLLFFVTPFALLSIICGVILIFLYGRDWFIASHWLHHKITLVIILCVYHGYCFKLLKDFSNDNNQRSHVFYRIFNELPVLLLIAIIILAVMKP